MVHRALLCLALAVPLAGQSSVTTSTRCQASEVPIEPDLAERRLLGCGEGFAENLLWHLDRSDSVAGTLDGKVTRKTTGRDAVIYVLDYGVLRAHEEFARSGGTNVIGGIDAGGPAACPDAAVAPCWFASPRTILIFGHGTGVASVAAGRTTGVAPDASIVSVLVAGRAHVWVEAFKKVIAHAYAAGTPQFKTAVISISGGVQGDPSPELEALIRRMVTGVDAAGNADPNGKRFLFVVGAGNYADGPENQCNAERAPKTYPAVAAPAIDGVVTVGGIDASNRFWTGSCSGAGVELAAPAENVLVASIYARDTYRFKPEFYSSGTSWATPYVSGMAARLLELQPELTPAQLETMLRASPSRVDGIPVPVMIEESAPPPGRRRRSVRH